MGKQRRTSGGRVYLLDELRGLAILLMIADHIAYDAYFLLHWEGMGWWFRQPMLTLRSSSSILFLLIAGVACRYSHSNLRRGAVCFGFGMLITLVTWIVIPGQLILFGILHLMGIAMMLVGVGQRLFDRIPPAVGLALALILTVLCWDIRFGRFGIPGLWQLELPAALYRFDLLSPLGFPGPGFHSADYFPLLPYFFLLLAGFYFGRYVKEHRLPDWAYASYCPPLGAMGRHSLVIYLVHQPLLYAVTLAIA